MDYPKLIVSNQKEESINIQWVNGKTSWAGLTRYVDQLMTIGTSCKCIKITLNP